MTKRPSIFMRTLSTPLILILVLAFLLALAAVAMADTYDGYKPGYYKEHNYVIIHQHLKTHFNEAIWISDWRTGTCLLQFRVSSER